MCKKKPAEEIDLPILERHFSEIYVRGMFEAMSVEGCLPLTTEILVGKDDIPRPPKESQEMASLIANSELQIIENAGHISCLEQPEIVNTYLLRFLDSKISQYLETV